MSKYRQPSGTGGFVKFTGNNNNEIIIKINKNLKRIQTALKIFT